MTLIRIRDVSSFGYDRLLAPLDVNAPDVIPTRHTEVLSGPGGGVSPAAPEPVLSPLEAARLEMAQMLVMVYGMFDVDDCVIALKRNNDDPDRAANWLMDDSSQRVLRAERVRAPVFVWMIQHAHRPCCDSLRRPSPHPQEKEALQVGSHPLSRRIRLD
jgi:hypothetical protein